MAGAVGVGKGPRSDINITPLVDVVLVLLIIFMRAHSADGEGAGGSRSRRHQRADAAAGSDRAAVAVQGRRDRDRFLLNGTYYDDDAIITQLHNAYKGARAKSSEPPVIFFDADDKAKYVRAVKALDAIRVDSTINSHRMDDRT